MSARPCFVTRQNAAMDETPPRGTFVTRDAMSSADELEATVLAASLGWEPEDAFEPLMPAKGHVGPCRICGVATVMTEEHLPPKGAFNSGRSRGATLEDWLARSGAGAEPSGRLRQGGNRGAMLCADCNNGTGRFGREYQGWAVAIVDMVRRLPESVDEIDRASTPRGVSIELPRARPARFVRQVIAMMLCVSGSAELAARYPALRDLALGGAPQPMPIGLRLFLTAVYLTPTTRLVGGPTGQLKIDPSEKAGVRVLEIAHIPFAFALLLEGDATMIPGADMGSFVELDLDRVCSVTLEETLLGFGHTPLPLDYRSAGQIEAGRLA
jgi:hypothetical protein